MSFDPPPFPGADEEYDYGNIKWKFDATAGVWNIVDGSLVGERGPQGDPGPRGETGATGATGDPSAGDGGAIIVNGGYVTARLGGFGVTGVLGVTGRFSVANGIVGLLPASVGASGIASFDSTYFTVSGTGHVSLVSGVGGPTGHTVIPGLAIGVSSAGGNIRAINNLGVTSVNGLTGAITITGDNGAIVGVGNNTIAARLAEAGKTGVASFPASFFSVSNGAVSLSGPYASIGVTGVRVGDGGVNLTGLITLTAGSSNLTIVRSGNQITFDSVGGAGTIGGSQDQVLYHNAGGAAGSSNFLFNGTSATFGGANTQFTITGPTFNIGNNTVVRGGVFYDAAESAPYRALNSSINVIASGGSVQRIRITPGTNYTVTIDDGVAGNWNNTVGVAESVVVILQSTNGRTGQFDSTILTPSPRPILGGITGGVDAFTLMRIATNDGSIKMAFQIARGMTAPNVSIGTA